ncbi:MAG: hypothetical protein ABIH99_02705 [Candidatus Micrarchaeota archaeon]
MIFGAKQKVISQSGFTLKNTQRNRAFFKEHKELLETIDKRSKRSPPPTVEDKINASLALVKTEPKPTAEILKQAAMHEETKFLKEQYSNCAKVADTERKHNNALYAMAISMTVTCTTGLISIFSVTPQASSSIWNLIIGGICILSAAVTITSTGFFTFFADKLSNLKTKIYYVAKPKSANIVEN